LAADGNWAAAHARHASLIRVPNALRGLQSTAGRQGRRPLFTQFNLATSCDSSGGSTWLVSPSLLTRSPVADRQRSYAPRRAHAQPPV